MYIYVLLYKILKKFYKLYHIQKHFLIILYLNAAYWNCLNLWYNLLGYSKECLPVFINKGTDMSLVVKVSMVTDAIWMYAKVVQGQVDYIHPENERIGFTFIHIKDTSYPIYYIYYITYTYKLLCRIACTHIHWNTLSIG